VNSAVGSETIRKSQIEVLEVYLKNNRGSLILRYIFRAEDLYTLIVCAKQE
jgi:hypothetical protein